MLQPMKMETNSVFNFFSLFFQIFMVFHAKSDHNWAGSSDISVLILVNNDLNNIYYFQRFMIMVEKN